MRLRTYSVFAFIVMAITVGVVTALTPGPVQASGQRMAIGEGPTSCIGSGCSTNQGVIFEITPAGAQPPAVVTPPSDAAPVAQPVTGNLPKTGPTATLFTGLIGVLLLQIGLMLVVRTTRRPVRASQPTAI